MKMVVFILFKKYRIKLTDTEDVVRAMSEAVRIVCEGKHDPLKAHNRIKNFYDWSEITERTEHVYEGVLRSQPYDFWTRFSRQVVYEEFV